MIRAYRLKLAGLIAVFCCLVIFANVSYGKGTRAHHKIESPSIAKNKVGYSSTRWIDVYLPENYGNSDYRFPTFYWIGGYHDWSIHNYPKMLDEAIQDFSMPPVIVVFINTPEGTWFFNSDAFGYWEDFLIKEIIPFIDGTYKTIPNKSGRAIGGHSSGGFDAMMFPLWYPDIWGAIGTNDAAFWKPWIYIIDKEEIESFDQEFKNMAMLLGMNNRKNLFNIISKSNIADFNNVVQEVQSVWQFAAKISPNSDKPNLVDFPMTEDGEWIPDIRDKWREFCITEPQVIEKYRPELESLSINIAAAYNYVDIIVSDYLIELLESAGIPVNRMEMPGGHMDFIDERFIVLAKAVLGGLDIVSVESKGKLPIAWGKIKSQI